MEDAYNVDDDLQVTFKEVLENIFKNYDQDRQAMRYLCLLN